MPSNFSQGLHKKKPIIDADSGASRLNPPPKAKAPNPKAASKPQAVMKNGGLKTAPSKKTAEAEPPITYAKNDTRNGRLHDTKTDRGTFRFKDNRKGGD